MSYGSYLLSGRSRNPSGFPSPINIIGYRRINVLLYITILLAQSLNIDTEPTLPILGNSENWTFIKLSTHQGKSSWVNPNCLLVFSSSDSRSNSKEGVSEGSPNQLSLLSESSPSDCSWGQGYCSLRWIFWKRTGESSSTESITP